MEKIRHQWNAGGCYDEHGQRMVAVVDRDNNRIIFADTSRGIPGEILLGDYAHSFDKYTIEKLVMTNYNYGNYSHSFELLDWEDGE